MLNKHEALTKPKSFKNQIDSRKKRSRTVEMFKPIA